MLYKVKQKLYIMPDYNKDSEVIRYKELTALEICLPLKRYFWPEKKLVNIIYLYTSPPPDKN